MEYRTFKILLILGLLSILSSKRIIWDEVISEARLQARLETFNSWYSNFNPNNVEARLTGAIDSTRIGLFTKVNLPAEETYLKLTKSHMITPDLIYDTNIGPLIKQLEQEYGYDDYNNLIFYLLHEMGNKDSIWKAYLDLLPRQPTSIAFKYWEKKFWIEEELIHTPILREIIDYKFDIEKKSRNIYEAVVKNNTEIFDQEIFNIENLEWACLILDSRLIYVNFEAFLIPMLDFANYRENSDNPSRVFRPRFNSESTSTEIKSPQAFAAGQEIFENLGTSNDKYLLNHGIVLHENSHDCYKISLSFSERNSDALREVRKNFFARYFLYDRNHVDMIDECVSLNNPFPRRLMFYYYTLLLDEIDMEKLDIKRSGLEQDAIVVDYVKNALVNLLQLYHSTAESDQNRANREPEAYKKNVIQYMVEQKTILAKLINLYQDHMNKLNKDDVL